MNISDEGTKVNWTDKANLARESFQEVLASDKHEDSKAQRILTAMAFLTAAAVLVFAELSQPEVVASLKFPIFTNYAYIPVCFFAFIATILVGTLFFLAALGPTFNIPTPWHTKDAEIYPQSLLFSQLILEGTRDQWEKHWEGSSDEELRVELAKNYVNEAYLLAQKVNFKVQSMRIGKIFYKLSLGFLGMLVIPVFTSVASQVYSWACWVFAVVLLLDLLERAWSPPAWWWQVEKRRKGTFMWRNLFSISLVGTFIEFGLSIFLIVKAITY